jgi:hypothetical protein
MSLDIATPRGQRTLADEQIVAAWLESRGTKYIQTPKDKPAKVDAILVRDGAIFAVAETKCRYGMNLKTLRHQFDNEWLVTEAKIKEASQIAAGLCVPLVGFLYLVDDDTLLSVNLFNAPRRVANTQTQRTVNGGSIIRANAYIKMDHANTYYGIRKHIEEASAW